MPTTATQSPSGSPSSTPASASFSTGCNASDNTFFTPSNAAAFNKPFTINGTVVTYRIHCDTNFADKTSGSNPQITKLQQVNNLTTFEECITACAGYNQALINSGNKPGWGDLCSGVVMRQPDGQPTMCDLDKGMLENATNVGHGNRHEITSAVLFWNFDS
jgi:hypothetical protein